ncbi:MAG: hypothetical protein ACXWFJ_10150, partial [Candidatus Aminicenantales bacterium]
MVHQEDKYDEQKPDEEGRNDLAQEVPVDKARHVCKEYIRNAALKEEGVKPKILKFFWQALLSSLDGQDCRFWKKFKSLGLNP